MQMVQHEIPFNAHFIVDTGSAPGAGQPAQPPRPPMSPPPPDQTRYWGPFGNPFNASNGMPAIRSPWAELVAYDPNEGTIKWRRTQGTIPGLAAQGIKNTGSVPSEEWTGCDRRWIDSCRIVRRRLPPRFRQGHWKGPLGEPSSKGVLTEFQRCTRLTGAIRGLYAAGGGMESSQERPNWRRKPIMYLRSLIQLEVEEKGD